MSQLLNWYGIHSNNKKTQMGTMAHSDHDTWQNQKPTPQLGSSTKGVKIFNNLFNVISEA